jgi:hypothetical protein
MCNHNKEKCIILKDRVNDPGLAFVGKVGLGPFWTLVQVLLYSDVVHVSVSSFVSSFRHTHTTTVGKIYTRMQIQDLIHDFHPINYKTTYDNYKEYGWLYSP